MKGSFLFFQLSSNNNKGSKRIIIIIRMRQGCHCPKGACAGCPNSPRDPLFIPPPWFVPWRRNSRVLHLLGLHILGPLARWLPFRFSQWEAAARVQKERLESSGYHPLGSHLDYGPWFGSCCVIWPLSMISPPYAGFLKPHAYLCK